METRVVKFNLKHFIEEYVFLHESRDKQGEKDLIEKFEYNFNSSSEPVKLAIESFIFNSKLCKEYPILWGLSTNRKVF